MIRGVCFDMDGLLFDTERMGAEVMDQAAALQGCSPVSYTHLDVYKRQVMGCAFCRCV